MNDTLREMLDEAERQLASYRALESDQMDDDAFVARGNGFCDTKYSDSFLQMRIETLENRVRELKMKLRNDI